MENICKDTSRVIKTIEDIISNQLEEKKKINEIPIENISSNKKINEINPIDTIDYKVLFLFISF